MKIVQVTPRYPPQTGGVETHVREISERLVKRGHNVTVLTADAGKEGFQRECRNNVRVRRFRSFAPDGSIHVCPSLATAVAHTDADLLHAHNYHSLPLIVAVESTTRPIVVTPHYHGGSSSMIRNLLLRLYRNIGTRALKKADKVISVSDWECNQLKDDLDIESCVIPNGVNTELLKNSEPIKRKRPYILYAGRVEKYKGIQFILKAMRDLPEFDLVIAGNGKYIDELEQIAKSYGISDRAEFLGFVSDEKLSRLYAGAEVFVTMSSFEAYGLTVAEALATGTPCVVRETGALTDWTIQEGCLGVLGTSSEEVSTAIRQARKLNVPDTLIPSWEEVCDKLERLYFSVV